MLSTLSPQEFVARWRSPTLSEADLKKRILTNLYNERPTWLDLIHRRLDQTVLDAYGWPHDLPDDEILARLLALNGQRAAAQVAALGYDRAHEEGAG